MELKINANNWVIQTVDAGGPQGSIQGLKLTKMIENQKQIYFLMMLKYLLDNYLKKKTDGFE